MCVFVVYASNNYTKFDLSQTGTMKVVHAKLMSFDILKACLNDVLDCEVLMSYI